MSKNQIQNAAQEVQELQKKLDETVQECAAKIAENKKLLAENQALQEERNGIGRSFRAIVQYAVSVANAYEKTTLLYASIVSTLQTMPLRKEGEKPSNGIGEKRTEISVFGDTIQKIEIR